MIGRVIRAITGHYYVEDQDDPAVIIECAVRGKVKKYNKEILVGDLVEYILNDTKGLITGVLPRNSILKRPFIANVDLLILVFAHHHPEPNDLLINRFIVLAAAAEIPFLIVFNKSDLVLKGNDLDIANKYISYGYQVISTSTITKSGELALQKAIEGKTAVLAGPSGVGKSAILNMLAPQYRLQTGELSQKVSRGKHTTREVRLLKVNHGYVADTPGFTQVNLDFLSPIDLAGVFPDFVEYLTECKYNDCLHTNEPGCGVKAAVVAGKINKMRYEVYCSILEEVQTNWKMRFR